MSLFRAGFLSVALMMGAVTAPLFHPSEAQAQTQNKAELAQAIANHFAAIKTMTGDFVQFGSKGQMSQGKFYLERPGKIRFTYDNSPIRVIADGKSVAVNNRKLNTWDLYQLYQTPLKLLLGNQINIGAGNLLRVDQTPQATTIVLTDKTLGKGYIRMIFDTKTNELREWTVVDQQKAETTVQIMNVRTGVKFANGMFDIPYQQIAMKKKQQ